MKPSRSAPNVGAPAAWVAANRRAKPSTLSTLGLPGSIQDSTRQSSPYASTSGTRAPSGAARSQSSPAASVAKKVPGAFERVLTKAVRPSLSRSRVAVQTSPPATGVVATTATPSSAAALPAIPPIRAMERRYGARRG
jgi:hypothetical protein